MKPPRSILGKNMGYHREQNIRILLVLLLITFFIFSCNFGPADNLSETVSDGEIRERPLDLRIDYRGFGEEPEMCEISIVGDSLFFYDNGSYECAVPDSRKRLVKKFRLKDWQIKNLQQLRNAVKPDSMEFSTFGNNFVTDDQAISFYIDGKSRLSIYGNDLEVSIPPALLTLLLYVKSVSPYDYTDKEWLKDRI